MAMCPLCFGEKSFLAPVCESCTHEVPFVLQVFGWLIYKAGQIFGFVVAWWFIFWIIGLLVGT